MTGNLIPNGSVEVGEPYSMEERPTPGVLPENQGLPQHIAMPSATPIIPNGRGP
jgi:hypothetical protein